MTPVEKHIEMARPTLAVLFLCVLIAASLWILRPFLPALIWATMVVVATWPLDAAGAAAFRQSPSAGGDPDDLAGSPGTGRAPVGGDCHHRRQCRSDCRLGPDR
jgi:fatty acid desaturase